MKTCLNCKEFVGDSSETCFNCNYNFKYAQILTKEEQKKLEKEGNHQIFENSLFEYKVIIVNNLADGQIDQRQIQRELDTWSNDGWKLHTIFNNELGKIFSAMAVGFWGTSINATIDQTVLIFERCIKS